VVASPRAPLLSLVRGRCCASGRAVRAFFLFAGKRPLLCFSDIHIAFCVKAWLPSRARLLLPRQPLALQGLLHTRRINVKQLYAYAWSVSEELRCRIVWHAYPTGTGRAIRPELRTEHPTYTCPMRYIL
jgi:hypothetical protein